MDARAGTQSQHQARTSQRQIKHSIVWVVWCGGVGRGMRVGGEGWEGERGCNRNAALVWGYVWDGVGSAYDVLGEQQAG